MIDTRVRTAHAEKWRRGRRSPGAFVTMIYVSMEQSPGPAHSYHSVSTDAIPPTMNTLI